MKYDEKWQERYRDMLVTAEQALARLRPGQRVFIGGGCAEPSVLVRAMVARAGELADVEIVQLLTKGEAPYAAKNLAGVFSVNSFFIGENVRETIREGHGSYTPILLSDVPRLFHSGQLPLDVALIQVTPPNERGKVSLGISVDVVKSAAQNASLVIAQVNPRMPWTRGDSLLEVGDLDLLVYAEEDLIERPSHPSHETSRQIGRYVAGLVPNGATV
ncbi:MAG: 4-hydroxybutyrate CoA-transferase, partial [Desulfobulbaceae bacterium A2]